MAIHFCPQKRSWRFLINNVLVKNFAFGKLIMVSNILKAKESPRVTFARTKRFSQQELTDQDLRRFYIRRNVSGMSGRHCFFCSCTSVKVLFTTTFLKCRTFPLRKNVVFFLNQSFLCIHVNKVSHYNMAYSQFSM